MECNLNRLTIKTTSRKLFFAGTNFYGSQFWDFLRELRFCGCLIWKKIRVILWIIRPFFSHLKNFAGTKFCGLGLNPQKGIFLPVWFCGLVTKQEFSVENDRYLFARYLHDYVFLIFLTVNQYTPMSYTLSPAPRWNFKIAGLTKMVENLFCKVFATEEKEQ